MSVTLYSLSEQLRAVHAALTENEGELTPEIEAALDAAEEGFKAKIQSICQLVANLEADQSMIAEHRDVLLEEAARLNAQVARRTRAIDGLKRYALRCMERAGERRVDTPLFTVWEHPNPVNVHWDGEGDPPEEYLLPVQPEPRRLNKLRIDDHLKATGTLPEGFRIERGSHLRIK